MNVTPVTRGRVGFITRIKGLRHRVKPYVQTLMHYP